MKGKITKALLSRIELLIQANPHNVDLRITHETLKTMYDNDNRYTRKSK